MWEIFNDDYTTHPFFLFTAMFAWFINDSECPLESWKTMLIRHSSQKVEPLPSFCDRNKDLLLLIKDALESKMKAIDWKKDGF